MDQWADTFGGDEEDSLGLDDVAEVAAAGIAAALLPMIFGGVKKGVEDVFSGFGARKRRVVALLSLDEVKQYFADKHPGSMDVVGGYLQRVHHPKGHLVVMGFMDAANELVTEPNTGRPVARVLIAQEMDPQLELAFAGKNTIIFR